MKKIEEMVHIAIKAALLSYRLSNFVDSDDDAFPLLDHLSIEGTDISTGRDEIDFLTDHISIKLKPILEKAKP